MNECYLGEKVELLEDLGSIKRGSVGLCTADLRDYLTGEENNVFAVRFLDYGWVAFHPNNKDKFKLCQ